MGSKVAVTSVDNIENQTSFLTTINANFTALADAFDSFVSRDGTVPNYFTASVDMNSNRILNLPSPESSNEPARWVDIQNSLKLTGYAIPTISGQGGKVLRTDGSSVYWAVNGSGDLISTNNLSELTNLTTARSNLGLGSSATYNTGVSGGAVPLLNGNNTWSGSASFSGSVSMSGDVTFSGLGDLRITNTPTTLHVDSVGYRGAPQNLQNNDYTFVLTDSGKGVSHSSSSAHTWTIPPQSSVNFPLHTVIILDNQGSGAVTVARGSGVTLRPNGSGTSANQSLAQYFTHSLYKVDTDTWTYL